jgi:enterochelin esterase-like enzyme
MGAVISLYAVLEYPNIFGGALLFSPAFWVTPSLYDAATKFITSNMPKFYFYAGGKAEYFHGVGHGKDGWHFAIKKSRSD